MLLFFGRTANVCPYNSLLDAADKKTLLNSKSKKIYLHNICKNISLFQDLHTGYVFLCHFQEDADNMIFLLKSKCCCFWNHNFHSNTFACDLHYNLSTLHQKYRITERTFNTSYERHFLGYESVLLVCKRKRLLSKIG